LGIYVHSFLGQPGHSINEPINDSFILVISAQQAHVFSCTQYLAYACNRSLNDSTVQRCVQTS